MTGKKFFLKIVLVTALVLNFAVLYFDSTSFKPKKEETVEPEGVFTKERAEKTFTVTTWNIGYGGLGEETDFFMDGGKTSLPESENLVEKNLKGIKSYLEQVKSDIFFIQEADRNSKRSYFKDEIKFLRKIFESYGSFFGLNFRSPYIPYPFSEPLGKVESGIMIYSKIKTQTGTRYQLPGSYKWPEKLFQLKRCALEIKIPFEKKEIVLINIHLSAFDDGTMRKEEMDFIKTKMIDEYSKGNYVIIGGDWNQMFPEIEKESFAPYKTDEKDLFWVKEMENNWKPEGWKFVYDKTVPTVRSDEKSYVKNENFTTVIDGFLISPNVEVLKIATDDLGFKFSDHNPVTAEFKIY